MRDLALCRDTQSTMGLIAVRLTRKLMFVLGAAGAKNGFPTADPRKRHLQ